MKRVDEKIHKQGVTVDFVNTVEPRYKNIIGPAHRILIEEVFLYKGN